MNIKDVNEPTLRDWSEIFELQARLNEMFEPGYFEKCKNFDISYHEDQEFFKHYCWCIIEELTEAIEAVELKEPTHIKEELIDALNFTMQLYGLYGWSYDDVKDSPVPDQIDMNIAILDAIYSIGLAANCLKNRVWRESQYLVDLYVFEPRLKAIWGKMIAIFRTQGIQDEDIRKLWDLKHQVNIFRIESKY